jgi:hypothetical protein
MPEAIGAKRKATLRGLIEKKLTLGIFVLTAFENDQLVIFVFKPGFVQLLFTIMRIGVSLDIIVNQLLSFLLRLGRLVFIYGFLPDHIGLWKDQLEEGIMLEIVPVDGIQDMSRGHETVDFYKQLPFLDIANINSLLSKSGNDFPESLQTGILFL